MMKSYKKAKKKKLLEISRKFTSELEAALNSPDQADDSYIYASESCKLLHLCVLGFI